MADMLELFRFLLTAALVVLGLLVLLSGVLGIFRFRYALSRIHAAGLFDTAGIFFMLLAVMVATGFTLTTLKLGLLIVFLWLTSPVSSHLIGRMEITINDHLERDLTVKAPEAVRHEKEGD